MRQALDRRNPGDKALFHLLRIQRRKDPIKRIVRWNTRWKRQKRLQPFQVVFAVLGNVPGSAPRADRAPLQNTSGDFPYPLVAYLHPRGI